MPSIKLSVGKGYDAEDAREIRKLIEDSDDLYPDYILYLAGDMRLIATPQELKECLAEALVHADRFETLYLGKLGEEARLVKQNIRREHRICLISPPLFDKQRKAKTQPRSPVEQETEEHNPSVVLGGMLFFAALVIALIYVSRRNAKNSGAK